MAIIIELPNATPYSIISGMAVKSLGEALKLPATPVESEFCYCHYECEYVEKVFGHLTDNDYWKNDKNTFTYRKLLNTDSITITLLKDGVVIETITDDSFGDFIDGYPTGNSEQQLYVVFTIFWQKVLQAHGGGVYRISTELNIVGTTTTEESQKFMLYGYSDINANKTVRIETVQNGNIIGSEFDFTGLNLYNSFRISGLFTETSPELEQDFYLNNSYEKKQIQDSAIPQYLLRTGRVPRSISLLMQRDSILANDIEITDYNILNVDRFRRVKVYPDSISKADLGRRNTKDAFEIAFKDKFEIIKKRNN